MRAGFRVTLCGVTRFPHCKLNLLEVLDPRTLAMSASLAGLVFSGVLWAALRDGDPIRGASEWFYAAVLISVALLANAMQDLLPDLVSRVIANVCLITAAFLLWHGARFYNQRSDVMRYVWLAAALAALGNVAFALIWSHTQARIAITSFGLLCGAGLAAYEIRRATGDHLRIGLRVTSYALMLFCVFMSIRLVHALLGGATPSTLTHNPMNTATHLVGNFVLLTTMAGLLMIVNSTRAHRIRALAFSDQLTGALSRRGFYAEINKFIDRPIKSGFLFVFDIDRFKMSNDAKGHETGDRLLKLLCDTLREHAPPNSLIARFGGDEFVVLAQHVDNAELFAIASRKAFSARSTSILNDSTLVGSGRSIKSVDVSVGWAPCERVDQAHLSQAMHNADRAMYDAKVKQRSLQPA
jgi:diguanylate cyclase (GGDEF)-like protein